MVSLEDLLAKSIPELNEIFITRQKPVPKGFLEALEVDTRQGAHQLARRIRERRRGNRQEGQRLHSILRFELELWADGYSFVAGVDEAGMAPLAGPVVAGAVILPRNYKLRGLNDSKKILDSEMRDELARQIKNDAVCWSFGVAEVEEIDKINIYHAGLLAMQRALQGLSCVPDFVLVDARRIPNCSAPQRGIVRGDALSASIAAASPRPKWIEICNIEHSSGNIIDFPMIQDLPSLLWVINLGCIDLNQWYARCDDVDRPDYLHFDLDPVPGASFEKVVEGSLFLKEALDSLKIPCYAKTTGSKGIHIYVPIVRGPTQGQVWSFAKEFSRAVAAQKPDLLTAIYKVSKRPRGRVLVDYNQNSWGRTLASIYSVRPHPRASVSTPVKWSELEKGVKIDDFRLDNVPARVRRLGDLWKPLLATRGRFKLEVFL